jgi:hypothetical protein
LEKVYINKTERDLNYATPEYLNDLLLFLKAKYNVPIYDAIRSLNKGEVDSISFSKKEPYFNFHATRNREAVFISIRETERDIEFNVPLNKLELCVNP